jgi:hypothetical protein
VKDAEGKKLCWHMTNGSGATLSLSPSLSLGLERTSGAQRGLSNPLSKLRTAKI